MQGDNGFYRFFAYLNLFMFAMLTLVLADNYLLMFVGWEGVGLCSYLADRLLHQQRRGAKSCKKSVCHEPHRRLGRSDGHFPDLCIDRINFIF